MTDIIYQRGAVRESIIWAPFQYNGPFNAIQTVERAIVFGLYANTYLYGHNYLIEIETEDLARLVDNYTVAIAQITNEEAKLALEIAAKYYIDRIDQQIHDLKMVTGRKKIDALDDEYDARTEALDADYAAITTKQAEVQLAWDKANQRIKELETQVQLETVAQELVDVDILEQQLRAARADLQLIEAGLQGLNIQLEITETGIAITNTNLQITEAGNEVSEIGIRVSDTEIAQSEADLDIVSAGIALSKAEAAGERIKVDTKGVAVQVSEAQLDIVEADLRQDQITAEIAGIDADVAKLALVDSEKRIIESDKRVMAAENELLVQEKKMITSQGDNVKDETILVGTQKTTQETLDTDILALENAENTGKIDMIEDTTAFEKAINQLKLNALEAERDLIDETKTLKLKESEYRGRLHALRALNTEMLVVAAVDAARQLAEADIVNTLTHSVGRA